jgi:hypothetical protein
MVKLKFESCTEPEWAAFSAQFRDQSLLQLPAYAKAKEMLGPWQVERGIFIRNEEMVGCVQALVRSIPVVGGGLVSINRGPLWRPIEGGEPKVSFHELIEALRHHYVDRQGFYVRLAPPQWKRDTYQMKNLKPQAV